MPHYEFECRNCGKTFAMFMRISERGTAKIRCPGCESEKVEGLLQAFTAKTTKKS